MAIDAPVRRRLVAALALVALLIPGCGGGDDGRYAFTLSLTGLPELAEGTGHYEVFAVVGTSDRTCGKFRVTGAGAGATVWNLSGSILYGELASFTLGPSNTQLGQDFPFIADTTAIFVTHEPEGDTDRVPSGNTILEGEWVGDTVALEPTGFTSAARAAIPDLASATGACVLATPTDDLTNAVANDASGVWFAGCAPLPGCTTPGLALPALAGSWVYEAFVTDGVSYWSTGRFRDPSARDDDAEADPTRGPDGIGPSFPGRDFVTPVTFPAIPVLDLASGDFEVLVTVEPEPDNDLGPFHLGLLEEEAIPEDAVTEGNQTAGDIALDSIAAELPTVEAAVTAASLTLSAIGLPDLGGLRAGRYEVFARIGGVTVSAGAFVIQGTAVLRPDLVVQYGTTASAVLDAVSTGLGAAFPDLTLATDLQISLEPQGDDDPLPAGRTLLAGALSGGLATLDTAGLTVSGGPGLADFAAVSGRYVLATPSDSGSGIPANDASGIYFRRSTGVSSLVLPVLPAGFVYEGWVRDVTVGNFLSTGRFLTPSGYDQNARVSPTRGTNNLGFPHPGEEFVTELAARNLPVLDLRGFDVLVTVEPEPDSDSAPFFVTVLRGTVPASAVQNGQTNGLVPLANVVAPLLPSGFAVRR